MDLTDFEILSISGIGPSGFLAWKGVVSAVKEHEQTEKERKIIEDEEISEINAFGDFSNILVEIAATHKSLADKYLELASIITPSGNYYE
jgi:hypothetical protein